MGDLCINPQACISFLAQFFRDTKETFELRALPSKARLFTRESRKVMDFTCARRLRISWEDSRAT